MSAYGEAFSHSLGRIVPVEAEIVSFLEFTATACGLKMHPAGP
jgi:hypothetical protein